MTTHKLVGIAHDKNHAGFFDGEKKKKALNDMEVTAGDTATYGDNVSENLHMTSKNEVKNNKFNFLNKQHLCNILFSFFLFLYGSPANVFVSGIHAFSAINIHAMHATTSALK